MQSDNWHKCRTPIFPRLTIDGKRTSFFHLGQTWRRWNGTRWEYQQDEETLDDWQSRQW